MIKPIANEISGRIIKELNKQKKTIYQMCQSVGMHEGSFSNTKNNPNSWNQCINLSKIAEYLNVTEKYLITGKMQQLDLNEIINKYKVENGNLNHLLSENKLKMNVLINTITDLITGPEKEKDIIFKQLISKLDI